MLLSVKNDEKQLTLFLTQCLYEAIDNKPGENPDQLKVLKLAPDTRQKDCITITNYMQTNLSKEKLNSRNHALSPK